MPSAEPITLFMDICGPRGTDLCDIRGQVEIRTLPPYCIAHYQSMDMDRSRWKNQHRRLLLRHILKDTETRQARRRHSKSLKVGMKDLVEVCDPHILSFCNWVKSSLDTLYAMNITRCWIKSKILPGRI